MSGPSEAGPPDQPAGEPRSRFRKRRPGPGSEALEPRIRQGLFVPWLQWIEAQPLLAVAVLLFCLVAVGGLVLTLPPGLWSAGRSTQEPASAPDPAPPEPTAPPAPASETAAAPGPWVVKPASAPSPRGLALVYAYRALPPGGDSRFEWYVQVQGPRPLLEEVDQVLWRMDPPPKNDAGDLVSRNRADDGFPLFGDGPGGWFGVSATVQFKDGREDTLSRRIELPE